MKNKTLIKADNKVKKFFSSLNSKIDDLALSSDKVTKKLVREAQRLLSVNYSIVSKSYKDPKTELFGFIVENFAIPGALALVFPSLYPFVAFKAKLTIGMYALGLTSNFYNTLVSVPFVAAEYTLMFTNLALYVSASFASILQEFAIRKTISAIDSTINFAKSIKDNITNFFSFNSKPKNNFNVSSNNNVIFLNSFKNNDTPEPKKQNKNEGWLTWGYNNVKSVFVTPKNTTNSNVNNKKYRLNTV